MPDVFHFSSKEFLWLSSIIMIAVFMYTMTRPLSPFASDESVYVYASYAITRGVIPYKEIYLAHPPLMFFIYAAFIRLFGPNFYYLRLSVSGIFLATIPLVYLMAKELLRSRNKDGKLGLACSAVYAFYPEIIHFLTTCTAESFFTLFTLASVTVYVYSFNRSQRKIHLFLMGLLMGLALITKLSAIFFITVLLFYYIATHRKEGRKIFSSILFVFLGIAIPSVCTLIWLINYCNAFRQFYLSMYYWPIVRYSQTFADKLSTLTWYTFSFLPLILSAILGALYSIWNARHEKNSLLLLPAVIYGANAVGLIFLTNSFFHYFLHLSPYLIFLSVTCFDQIYLIFRGREFKIDGKLNFRVISTFSFLLLIVILTASLTTRYIPNFYFFNENQYTSVDFYVGKYVMSITEMNDKIWTSEGAIAFFARRLIVAPNSSDWPLQAFFSDVFAHRWYTYVGYEMGDFREGIVLPYQFIEAWKEEDVKVIVIIRGRGWIPYPDELLWNGYRSQEGVASYVQSSYELRRVVSSLDVSYFYEIWVKE